MNTRKYKQTAHPPQDSLRRSDQIWYWLGTDSSAFGTGDWGGWVRWVNLLWAGRHTSPSSLMIQELKGRGGWPEQERKDDSCLEHGATGNSVSSSKPHHLLVNSTALSAHGTWNNGSHSLVHSFISLYIWGTPTRCQAPRIGRWVRNSRRSRCSRKGKRINNSLWEHERRASIAGEAGKTLQWSWLQQGFWRPSEFGRQWRGISHMKDTLVGKH